MWNIILDELLDQSLPPGCHLQAYADDVLLIVTAKNTQALERAANVALEQIASWGKSVKLTFGAPKTQAIAFTPKARAAHIRMDGHTVGFSKEIKLLGVILDERLTFRSHVRQVTGKAMRIFNKLCIYAKPTWGMCPDNIRTIYHHVIEPIITYAAGVWGHVAEKKWARTLLASTQRGFAIKAIRAFRTVSTSAALALAQFTPLDLRVREVCGLERTRLTGTTDLLPGDIRWEGLTPTHHLPHPADRIAVPHRMASSQLDIDTHTTPHTTQIYTDGSKQEDGAVGATFVCFDPGGAATGPTVKKFKLHDCCTVFQAELLAILHACRWARDRGYRDVTIFTDSLSSLMAINDRSNTHPLVSEIQDTLRELLGVGSVALSWVKSHVGIAGNELADTAANSATTLHKAPDYDRFPLSYVKHRARRAAQADWQSRYESAEQGRRTWRLLPDLQMIKKLWTMTEPDFHLTQVLTGHGFHREYLHRFKIIDDNTCPCDGATIQSLEHVLEGCPRFASLRHRHLMVCSLHKKNPYNIRDLIGHRAAFESYLGFVRATLGSLKEFNKSEP